jgi:hypothetical protein
MAQEYDNENRGSIWKNDKKETEKHPDFTGSLNVNGQEFWVSAWKRRPDQSDKAPALSFSIKAKDGGNGKPQGQDPKPNYQDDSDTIPF